MGKKKILLIDDERDLLDVMTEFISGLVETDHIDSAHNGKEAIEYLIKEDFYDLIICDYSMPEMDGVQFFNTLNDEQKKKVVFMTAFDPYEIDNNLNQPTAIFLKPINLADISKVIEQMKI